MLANLYLHSDAFRYNDIDTESEVANKLKCLVKDMRDVIADYSTENIFHVSSSLCCVPVYKKLELIDFAETHLENDEKGIFYSLIGNTTMEIDNLSLDEIREKSRFDYSSEEANSLVIINHIGESTYANSKYITFDTYEVVYNKSSWVTLRRQILGNYPGTHQEFVDNCRKYFTNIAFHDNCVDTLEDENYDYLKTCPRRIVYYLSCLSDKFKDTLDKFNYKTGETDSKRILEDFSGTFGFDEPASMQQDYKKKSALTFSFDEKYGKDNVCENVLCEPHLKISRPDSNYRGPSVGSDFHPRIYFNFDKGAEKDYYYVGIIGKHVE